MANFQSSTELHKEFNQWTISDHGGQSIQIGKGNLIVRKSDLPEFIKTLQYFFDNRIIEIYCGQKYIVEESVTIDDIQLLSFYLKKGAEILVSTHDNGSVTIEYERKEFKQTAILSRQQFCDAVRSNKIIYVEGGIR